MSVGIESSHAQGCDRGGRDATHGRWGARSTKAPSAPYTDFLHAGGLDGVLTLGTNGEGILLTVAERRRVTELFVEASRGRLLVAAHCGAQTTADTVSLAEHAAAAGADAVAVIGPPYFKLDPAAQRAHLLAAAHACAPLPFYVYEFAATAGYAFDPEMLRRLRDEADNVAGLKVSDTPWEAFERYLLDGLDVFVGPEALIHRGLEAGAVGAVSALASAFPAEVAAVVRNPTTEGAAGLAEIRAQVEGFPVTPRSSTCWGGRACPSGRVCARRYAVSRRTRQPGSTRGLRRSSAGLGPGTRALEERCRASARHRCSAYSSPVGRWRRRNLAATVVRAELVEAIVEPARAPRRSVPAATAGPSRGLARLAAAPGAGCRLRSVAAAARSAAATPSLVDWSREMPFASRSHCGESACGACGAASAAPAPPRAKSVTTTTAARVRRAVVTRWFSSHFVGRCSAHRHERVHGATGLNSVRSSRSGVIPVSRSGWRRTRLERRATLPTSERR